MGRHQRFHHAATAIAPHIKNAAAGGKVVDGTYRDIRFETTSGTQLAHETAIYDGPMGAGPGILLPSWVVNTKFRFLMYFGKSALGAAEENSAGVWAQAMAAIDPVSGVDGTGRGAASRQAASPQHPSPQATALLALLRYKQQVCFRHGGMARRPWNHSDRVLGKAKPQFPRPTTSFSASATPRASWSSAPIQQVITAAPPTRS